MGVVLATHAVPLVANLLRRLCQAICLDGVARTVLKAKQCERLGILRAVDKPAGSKEIAVHLRPHVTRIGQRAIEVEDGRAEGKRGGAELVERGKAGAQGSSGRCKGHGAHFHNVFHDEAGPHYTCKPAWHVCICIWAYEVKPIPA